MSENLIELESLVGEHVLDAVDLLTENMQAKYGDYCEDCEVIRFRLDGTVYTAIEDPSDGYRSCMDRLFASPDDSVRNVFPPIRVLAKMKESGEYGGKNDTLQLLDLVTGKVVMEVGTDNLDDYYPSFVSHFSPENMAINQVVSPQDTQHE